jgi:hypothetical protein
MATRKVFTFSTIVESVSFNSVTAAIFLPHHVIIELPKGRLKTNGIVNGVPFSLSVLYRKETGRYFPINAALRKMARVEPRDAVNVTFCVINTEKAELPVERETVLDDEDKARKIWKKFTVSMGKVLADYIVNAKQIDMRIRRAIEMVRKGRSGMLQPHGTRKRKNG